VQKEEFSLGWVDGFSLKVRLWTFEKPKNFRLADEYCNEL